MAAPTVIVLRDRAGMGAIVPAWEDLAANALEANPFYEPWIVLPAGDRCFETQPADLGAFYASGGAEAQSG